jgi:hypothetical protein
MVSSETADRVIVNVKLFGSNTNDGGNEATHLSGRVSRGGGIGHVFSDEG